VPVQPVFSYFRQSKVMFRKVRHSVTDKQTRTAEKECFAVHNNNTNIWWQNNAK